jgi:hypothetical protein
LAIGKTLGGIEGIGTDDGGGWTSLLGRVIIRTSEALTTLAHGTEIAFFGTPKGSTMLTEFGKVDEDGFNVPTGATYNINGSPHIHSGAVQRRLTSDLTLADGECLILSGYIDVGTHTLTLEGDAQLEVLV